MIQDIKPFVYDNSYKEKNVKNDDYIIIVKGRKQYMIISGDNEYEFITYDLFQKFDINVSLTYLFEISHKSFFMLDIQDKGYKEAIEYLEDNSYFKKTDITTFRDIRPMWKAFAGITAFQLFNWYNSRKYCGKCGCSMKKSHEERAMICPQCGSVEYPKICPAVIVAVTDGSRIIMTKYANREYVKYALIAGFTEIGESFEETVKREVMEEVGVKVKNITYYKSQPWSLSDTILAGFFCQLDGSDKFNIDTEELSVAKWIDRKDIPASTSDISLTNEMIEAFRTKSYPMYQKFEECNNELIK